MSNDRLTSSERYVKKTNTIILIIGLSSLLVFIFGLILLVSSDENVDIYNEPVFDTNDDIFAAAPTKEEVAIQDIEFSTVEDETPITMTPDPIIIGEVSLGTEAKNVLTLGTNGKYTIKISSVELAEPPAAGFVFNDKCSNMTLTGKETCHITMSWTPVVAGNVQNNFIISWHEINLGQENTKSAKVSVKGTAVDKDCGYCETTPIEEGVKKNGKFLQAGVGPDGKKIGNVDKDGIVTDDNGNII